jgi:glucose-1-phosphate thymidylyltransferase
MKDLRGVILHGGFGTKLRPLTHTGPKQLIPIANKPNSQYVLEDLKASGITEIAMVLGNIFPEKVKEYYGDGERFGVKIQYIQQDEPKGIAHAVYLCKDYVKDQPFVVYLGDNLLKGGISSFVHKFQDSDYDTMILLCQVKNPERFGVAKINQKGKLVKLIEKPKEPPSNYALTGIYFFKPLIFKMIERLKPSPRGELEITDAIQLLLKSNHNVGYQIVQGWWKDTGTPEDILEANRLVLDELKPEAEGRVESHSSVQGRVAIAKGSTIKKGALVRGPVVVGQNTVIETNVYVGPYTSIGNNCTIKKGEIENSIIMDNCTIDMKERITDSIIGPYSELTTNRSKPHGKKFILGERTCIEL